MMILFMKEKLRNSLNRMEKKHPGGYTALKMIIAFIALLFFLSPGIWFDRVYQGSWEFGKEIVELIRKYNLLGVSYQKAVGTLNSNFAVVITVLSIFVTMNGNIAERSEKKVFGIPRYELNFYAHSDWYKRTRKMIWFSPGLMLLFINLGYCLTCYMLLGYCYLFLLAHYVLYHRSYSREKGQKAVCSKLLFCVKKSVNAEKGEMRAYQSFLEDIRGSIETTGDLRNAENLFEEFIEHAMEYDEKKCYLLSYYFFSIVFWKNGRKNREPVLEMMEDCMDNFGNSLLMEGDLYEKKFAVLWGMLCAQYENAKEEELIDFMRWFLDITGRSRAFVWSNDKILKLEVIQRQTLQMLMLSESWVLNNPVTDPVFAELLDGLWSYTETVQEEMVRAYWQTLCMFYLLTGENWKCKAQQSWDRLYQDIFYNKRLSGLSVILLAGR